MASFEFGKRCLVGLRTAPGFGKFCLVGLHMFFAASSYGVHLFTSHQSRPLTFT